MHKVFESLRGRVRAAELTTFYNYLKKKTKQKYIYVYILHIFHNGKNNINWYKSVQSPNK